MSNQRKVCFEVKWRMENLGPWFETRNDTLYSPQFLAKTLMNSFWKLKVSRKLLLEEKYFTLELERDVENGQPEPMDLHYELSVLACDGSALKSRTCKTKFIPKTVSQELNVKEIEILAEKRDVYLPEGALTVCCKLWKPRSTSKEECCSIRSVIGRKCITLDGTIANFSTLDYDSKVTVNFLSTCPEINFISFDIHRQPHEPLWLERMKVECKYFSSYSCKLFALDARGKRKESMTHLHLETLLTSQKSCAFQSYRHGRFCEQGYLKNDTLTLQLEITYFPGIESEYIEYRDNNDEKQIDESVGMEGANSYISEKTGSIALDNRHPSEYGSKPSSDEEESLHAAENRNMLSSTLKADLTSLYENHLFADTKLQTCTETFPAHRNILSVRSPVFKKMFTTDMKEKAGECINIQDISSDTVRRMLQFIYTDWIENLNVQSAKDLYIAADKYDIASLKERCTSFIKKNLCPANVCEILVLADMHQDKNLESSAQEYVLDNDEEVFCSDEWMLFMQNYCGLAAKLMYMKCKKK